MKNKESNKENPTKIDTLPICDCPGNTWVYVWKMTAQKVGHTAIQVGGCKPKLEQDDHGEYISIHPNMIPSIGPTVILPLPAGLAGTLSHDMAAEAGSQNNDMLGELTGIPSEHSPTSCPPDYTFNIPNLKTDVMRNMIAATRDEVKTGQTTYQLLPKVNTLQFFKEIPQFISYNPVDIGSTPKPPQGNNRYNCATLVSSILKEGGMPIRQSIMPWGQTPNDLAEQLYCARAVYL
ncbi:MAG: hypothetical protein Q8R24_06475 [Legionellaceae bacterium]|nr:hypothetical protein [Legionellaceae bacterium]